MDSTNIPTQPKQPDQQNQYYINIIQHKKNYYSFNMLLQNKCQVMICFPLKVYRYFYFTPYKENPRFPAIIETLTKQR